MLSADRGMLMIFYQFRDGHDKTLLIKNSLVSAVHSLRKNSWPTPESSQQKKVQVAHLPSGPCRELPFGNVTVSLCFFTASPRMDDAVAIGLPDNPPVVRAVAVVRVLILPNRRFVQLQPRHGFPDGRSWKPASLRFPRWVSDRGSCRLH